MNRHRWTGCAVRLGDGQYSNCGYSFGRSWLTAARPAGTADRRRSGQPVAAIAAETGLSGHADNTDPSRAQYLRPYLVRAVRRAVSGASCRTRSAPSLTRGAPPPRRPSALPAVPDQSRPTIAWSRDVGVPGYEVPGLVERQERLVVSRRHRFAPSPDDEHRGGSRVFEVFSGFTERDV